MNPSHREGWPPSSGPAYSNMPRSSESQGPRAPGQAGNYGSNTPSHQGSQPSGPVLPPPPGPFHPAASGPSGPSFPSMPGMAQHSPTHQRRTSLSQYEHQQNMQHHVSQQGYSLPSINQAAPGHHMPPQQAHDRDRELHDAREREAREREYDQSRRERENRERDMREQAAPHHSHNESVQLHQPVAIGPRMQSAIHGPNGLLSNSLPGGQSQAPPPQNAPSSLFGQQYEGTPRMSVQQPPPQGPAHVSFGGTPTMHPASGALGPGQQPILNDALSYLDQVKVQFSGEPNVYNQFLDIMKDFKSQAIDTPGVIRRVSSLFAGNPNLIQGFNTFLPPGYRIECGSDGDPNAIRVTTPMGHTVSPMGSTLRPISRPRSAVNDGSVQMQRFDSAGRPVDGRWPHHPEHVDGSFSPGNRPHQGYSSHTGLHQGRMSPFEPGAPRDHVGGANSVLAAHQQEARGVSQLQNAVSAANGEPPRQTMASAPSPTKSSTPLPGGANGPPPQQSGPPGSEKRGPVEFNHAISYVNKIKNRFASQPEIYKQFLEILQTYQRESKPIQDVYAQVTHLFDGAPDLLEDFKQFLPESAAHAKAVAARQAAEDMTMLSNIRGDGYAPQAPRSRTPRPEQHRLPPVGNFAPTPSARDSKRKRENRDRQTQVGAAAAMNLAGGGPDYGTAGGASRNGFAPNKRAKPSQQPPVVKPQAQVEGPPVSPTLVPALPEPMAPSTSTVATVDELQFFDRVKKFVANKSIMNEFLKVCNLYSQDLIDKNTLVYRVGNFIGSNAELFSWFKVFVKYDGKDQVIENRAKPPSGRISLNNCRAYGPSYRLLPKRERLKACSGRDELCNSVLNDEWASHPTWASEDSGFIAHRKNTYEEALHRIEEERFDYDLNIAKIERSIQILEPLAQQNRRMTEEDRARWTLPQDLGGQTQPICKSVTAKVYGREESAKIMRALLDHPGSVIPVMLTRFRMKAEEWKAAQREWDKVWRDQTQKMFWKSLDHQAVSQKQSDKRQFQTKTLQNEIQVKYEEQKRAALLSHTVVPKHQAVYRFTDMAVLMDASHLLLTHAEHAHSMDAPALTTFIKDFVPLFFGIDSEAFQQRIRDVFEHPSSNEEMDEDAMASDDSNLPRGRKMNGRKPDLLQRVLGKGRKAGQADKEDSVASGSRATTPDVASVADEEMASVELPEEDGSPKTWMHHPIEGNVRRQRDIRPNEPYQRQTYNLYANLPIYCFFRMFVILYERLYSLKTNEREVHEAVRRAKSPKAALDLKMSEKHPDSFFNDTGPNANYYHQMLNMFEEFVKGEGGIDMAHIEDVLRRFYLQTGWLLYHFDKMLSALVRFAIAIQSNDGKDRSVEMIGLFQKDRKKEMTTHQDELNYRRLVEKYIKEGDTYRITFNPTTMTATTRILKRHETTFDVSAVTSATPAGALEEDGMFTPEQRWAYYISSYTTFAPTEGVPGGLPSPFVKRSLRKILKRNAPNTATAAAAISSVLGKNAEAVDDHALQNLEGARLDNARSHEALGLRISPDNYKIYYSVTDSEEWWLAAGGAKGKAAAPTQSSPAGEPVDPAGTSTDTALPEPDDTAMTGTGDVDGDGDGAAEADVDADADADDESKAAAPTEAKQEDDGAADQDMAEPEPEPEPEPAAATTDGAVAAAAAAAVAEGEDEAQRADPASEFEERFVMNNRWMAGLSKDEVDAANVEFRAWKAAAPADDAPDAA